MCTRWILGAQVLAAGFLLAACADGPPRMVVDPELEAMEANSMSYGFRANMTREGVREFFVEADTALFFQDSTVVYLRGHVKLTAYNEEFGTEKAIVTSDRGRLETDTNELLAEGNAVLFIQVGERRIESYELRYTPETDNIRSDSAVVMYEGNDIIEGTSFTSDLNFERIDIRNARTRGGAVRF